MFEGELTDEKKKELLEGWLKIVQDECDMYLVERDNKMKIYSEKKSQYDKILTKKLKWINMVEKRLNKRRKQLEEIKTEIKKLESV
jgi:hypothetical protein